VGLSLSLGISGSQWERRSWRTLTLVPEVPPDLLCIPRNSLSALGQVLPELLDLAVLYAQHAAQQLHHIVLKLVIVQPGEDARKEQKQAFWRTKSGEKTTKDCTGTQPPHDICPSQGQKINPS